MSFMGSIKRRQKEVPTNPSRELLSQYSVQCDWLRNEKFLRDLEGDSVDTEILNEELRSLQGEQITTCRANTLKFLEGNPFQIVLCMLVLIDASIVICEILMDLHATRGRYREASEDLSSAVHFFNNIYADDLRHHNGSNIREILQVLHQKYALTGRQRTAKSKRHVTPIPNAVLFDSNELNMAETRRLFLSSIRRTLRRCDVMATRCESNCKSRDRRNSESVRVTRGTTQWQETKNGNKHFPHAERLLKVAHILHYCSIAILGVFVIQLFVKMFALGRGFFQRKMEIFDAIIILTSFALDLVFLDGIGSAQGEEAAALLVLFLLWRILRVINGIMVASKKRQDFRIKLQKRARRRIEKKVEILEEERHVKLKELTALRQLCLAHGVSRDVVAASKPRRRGLLQKLDTSLGLSSIASLSLGLSMSMSGGGAMLRPCNNLTTARRESAPSLPFLGTGHRKSSLAFLSSSSSPSFAETLLTKLDEEHGEPRSETASEEDRTHRSESDLSKDCSSQAMQDGNLTECGIHRTSSEGDKKAISVVRQTAVDGENGIENVSMEHIMKDELTNEKEQTLAVLQ